MTSTTTPCAACKLQRRKCTQECVFAPYFPPDQPQKFETVHKVFGASNVAKILSELAPAQREDAVNSLAYEADARLRDPVYGCVGLISILQHRLKQVQINLYNAKKELATYIGPQAMLPILNLQNYPQPQQQMVEAQQLAAVLAAREQQEIMRSYEQQQQQEFVRFGGGGFDPVGGNVFNQMNGSVVAGSGLGVGVGSFVDNSGYQIPQQGQAQEHSQSNQQQLQLQSQVLIQQQQQLQVIPKQQQKRSGSEEGRSVV
ncbi:hypothetical protein RHMOL_Rhmol10G0155900 [Rhododendron molle]|uniref:Uncharacterized protein n=1 Tax=Rhododendron molle TaxID=49168 RepID=A0ACC0M3P0_RHOML|nr:hypothetical protein RHMOL_Rhmol10G0155900 [Rhododendron molle]